MSPFIKSALKTHQPTRIYYWVALIFFLFWVSACSPKVIVETALPASTATAAATTSPPTVSPVPSPTTSSTPAPPATLVLTVLYTNDEHGWMAGVEPGRGAAELAGLWQTNFPETDLFLILSGGDNWTGPAISTWFEGAGMVEIMNQMGYAASVVGNHEFDFGLDGMQQRFLEADFPYLGANIRYKSTGQTPVDVGIHPYTLIDIAEIKIGLIGLANTLTPSVTNPKNIAVFDFLAYEPTLREIVPQVRAEGADLIFVPSHLCTRELVPLVNAVADLDISFFGGGHCNEEFSLRIGDTALVSGGDSFEAYAYSTFTLQRDPFTVVDIRHGVQPNRGGSPDPQVAAIVAGWQARTDQELEVVIGQIETEIPRKSDQMAALITESWLQAYPADVALTNWGGMRDRIPAGEITISDVISVMPFDNVLMDVKLTGAQLKAVLAHGSTTPPVGGAHREVGRWVLDRSGEPIADDQLYVLLTTDFLYYGGDGYDMLVDYDPAAYNTSISWRQPVLDWLELETEKIQAPLDAAIAALLD